MCQAGKGQEKVRKRSDSLGFSPSQLHLKISALLSVAIV
jgi:hypothetical protein